MFDESRINVNVQGNSVPQTGHFLKFRDGDDGDLQKGVPWPNPRFIKPGDGTVVDTLTGLIWLHDPRCYSATSEFSALDWIAAMDAVVELNSGGSMATNDCGDTSNNGSYQTDWRLPNVREMHSLIYFRTWGPAISNTAGDSQWTMDDPFSSDPQGRYWTSSFAMPNARVKWWVDTTRGGIQSTGEVEEFANVWPVRGGNLP